MLQSGREKHILLSFFAGFGRERRLHRSPAVTGAKGLFCNFIPTGASVISRRFCAGDEILELRIKLSARPTRS